MTAPIDLDALRAAVADAGAPWTVIGKPGATTVVMNAAPALIEAATALVRWREAERELDAACKDTSPDARFARAYVRQGEARSALLTLAAGFTTNDRKDGT